MATTKVMPQPPDVTRGFTKFLSDSLCFLNEVNAPTTGEEESEHAWSRARLASLGNWGRMVEAFLFSGDGDSLKAWMAREAVRLACGCRTGEDALNLVEHYRIQSWQHDQIQKAAAQLHYHAMVIGETQVAEEFQVGDLSDTIERLQGLTILFNREVA